MLERRWSGQKSGVCFSAFAWHERVLRESWFEHVSLQGIFCVRFRIAGLQRRAFRHVSPILPAPFARSSSPIAIARFVPSVVFPDLVANNLSLPFTDSI